MSQEFQVLRYLKQILVQLETKGTPKIENSRIELIRAALARTQMTIPEAISQECCRVYNKLDLNGKSIYLSFIADELGHTTDSTPLYSKFFQQVMHQSGGLLFLVNLRKDLIPIRNETKKLKFLDNFLINMLRMCFSHSFLQLRRIDWDTSCSILEEIKKYESVHKLNSIEELKQRLGKARRMFAYFHNAFSTTPLAFISVALTDRISNSVDRILNDTVQEVSDETKCAIFYSISSTQKGLSGIDLGSSLIKDVVAKLQQENPRIKTFSTLSPIPGFSNWLQHNFDKFPGLVEQFHDPSKVNFTDQNVKHQLMKACE